MNEQPFIQIKQTKTRDGQTRELTIGPSGARVVLRLLFVLLSLLLVSAGVGPDGLLDLLNSLGSR